ncbi:hypothetical protein P7K49_029559, partial [Saguinus oedipus]
AALRRLAGSSRLQGGPAPAALSDRSDEIARPWLLPAPAPVQPRAEPSQQLLFPPIRHPLLDPQTPLHFNPTCSAFCRICFPLLNDFVPVHYPVVGVALPSSSCVSLQKACICRRLVRRGPNFHYMPSYPPTPLPSPYYESRPAARPHPPPRGPDRPRTQRRGPLAGTEPGRRRSAPWSLCSLAVDTGTQDHGHPPSACAASRASLCV